jgi:hypothetical protein
MLATIRSPIRHPHDMRVLLDAVILLKRSWWFIVEVTKRGR